MRFCYTFAIAYRLQKPDMGEAVGKQIIWKAFIRRLFLTPWNLAVSNLSQG